ncbi:MAG: 16S rRNA (cytidine(1402)-2'-O)-methyltransferase [Lachnospiraceae bacterium]|jgi:16S rRNA (cytidine1402-2'-O)-methyltransferase
MAGKLYLCATPIGNLKDITFRVVETLKEVDLIAAEDTRHTLGLLNHYGIKAKLTAYHEHNKYDKAQELVAMLQEGQSIALVTDAGTPGISDPGEELVRMCIEAGIEVTSLPGACALVTALSMCGLPSGKFVFEGFLPVNKSERKAALSRIRDETRTIVIYEAPHRIVKTLKELLDVLGDRNIRICKELTKIYETLMIVTVSEAVRHFEENSPRGEMVVIIEGANEAELEKARINSWQQMSLEEHMSLYTCKGISEKDAMKQVASDRGVSKRDVYNRLKV